MLTIYSDHITPRLRYTLEVIFIDIVGCPIQLTEDKNNLGRGPSLNYSNDLIDGIPYIRPHSLLFENGIRRLAETLNEDGSLFACESDLIDHDIFASSFFFLSRYEEYLIEERDDFGRIRARDCQMFKAGLLEEPLVDQWSLALYNGLRAKYPLLPASKRQFQVLPTFDIDVAYAYLGRGWLRRSRSSFKDFVTFRWKRIKKRKAVIKGDSPDDYDSYSYQQRICEQAGARPRHFFLLGDYGPYDRNLSHRRKVMQRLITDVSVWSDIGIHPSMRSNQSLGRLQKEIERLKKISPISVERSRQHFLKLDLPTTYENLISLGIKEDYTMGFADHVGFRAGTCSPYKWYDLRKDLPTDLYLIPTHVMDSTLKDYQGLSIEQSMNKMISLRTKVESVKGTLVILWHNHSAAKHGEWKGWRAVLEAGLFG